MSLLTQFADFGYRYHANFSYPAHDIITIGLIALIILAIAVVAYVVAAFILSVIFKKAGVPTWAAWVPVYNEWKLLQLGGQWGGWAILFFIPYVSFVAAIFLYIAMYRIGKGFGKSDAFVLWAIFLPFVWYVWLAVDDSTWNPARANGISDGETN